MDTQERRARMDALRSRFGEFFHIGYSNGTWLARRRVTGAECRETDPARLQAGMIEDLQRRPPAPRPGDDVPGDEGTGSIRDPGLYAGGSL
jgi:hypothetical protein